MLKLIKDFIKTKPRLYDYFNEIRTLDDELDLWLDNYSNSHDRPINFFRLEQVTDCDGIPFENLS